MPASAKKVDSAVETHQFDAQTDKLFQLVIHSIYENKDIFLRELVSNASDACDKLRYQALGGEAAEASDRPFRIEVTLDKEAGTITVKDNGIGMTREELMDNLGTIARSGTQNFLENLTGDTKKDNQLIGQFGLGFYSAFMVADRVEVISQGYGQQEAHLWQSDGKGEYHIEPAEPLGDSGTQITLFISEEEKEYLDQFRLEHILKTYSSHIAFPLELKAEDESHVINKGEAIWRKPKGDVTQEEYSAFYKSISYLGNDEPWMTLHNKVEGAVEYNNLLFIPSTKPFDLFHPDRETRVKLYIKRVFIADTGIELIPAYMRFLRGVVDSEDLPLNISRETIQNSRVLHKIKDSITKRVLKELKQKADKDPESFEQFWTNFGQVLKEGLCDAMEPRDELLEACRFVTSESEGKLVSLASYVERMKENQKQIFYLTGESYDTLLTSPQLEGFKKRGIEVLLLADSVDEFWVNVVPSYQDKSLQSVTRGTIDLNDIVPLKDEKTSEDESEPDREKASEKDMDALITRFKETLGEQVKDVRTTSKLSDSPVCLTAPEGGMDIRMERFMMENKQLPHVSAKILEINPEHPIITKLAQQAQAKSNQVEDTIQLLFAQANIAEGEPVTDSAGFAKRLNALIANAL